MRQHDPVDLGTAIYRSFAHRSPNTEPTSFGDALGWFVKAAGGNVSAAARLAGVPRRSMRDWLAGTSTPGPERRAHVAATAQLSERRARLAPGREKRIRALDGPGATSLVGTYNYDGDEREVLIGPYLDDTTIPDMLDAYLSGASPEDLRERFAGHITNDPTGFYPRTLARPPSDDHGWTVRRFSF